MMKRFSVIKKIVEEKKVHSQQVQLERQQRVFLEQDDFAVGDLVFLRDQIQPHCKLVQGLNRYDLIVGIELPEKRNDLQIVGNLLLKAFDEFCNRISNVSLAHEICLEIVPVMEDYKIQEKMYQRRIARRLEYD